MGIPALQGGEDVNTNIAGPEKALGVTKMKNWWKIMIAAISSIILIWKDWFSRESKAKREAYEKAEQKIDSDADTADLQSDLDDLLNGM